MTKIKDIQIYNERMAKSVMDKLFFLDKIEHGILVDLGCADGYLIKTMKNLFPDNHYIGIDNNKEMVTIARQDLLNTSNVNIYDNITEAISRIVALKRELPELKVTLILSSILHEMEDKIRFFKNSLFYNFDYIVIRDMFFTTNMTPFISSSAKNYIIGKLPERITKYYGETIYKDENFIQSLFKSYYTENIETEVKEDYFSLKEEHLIMLNILYGYEPIYREEYTLPYWQNTILQDFEIPLTEVTTHIKLIYTRT